MKGWSKNLLRPFRGVVLAAVAVGALQACATYTYEGRGYVSSDADYYGYSQEYADDSLASGYPLVDLRIVNAAYYPWWSLDYYYLGNHYYRPVYLGYSSGWYQSLGHLYSYPPYYAPYGFFGPTQYPGGPWSVYYDPIYGPWYGWPGYYGPGLGFAWTSRYWSRQYDRYAEVHDPINREPQYGTARTARESLRDGLYGDPRDRAPASSRQSQPTWISSPTRNVSMAPASASNNSTMRVRSRADRKVRESTTGTVPAGSVTDKSGYSAPVTAPQPTTGISIRPSNSVRQPARTIRQVPAPQPRPTMPTQTRPSTLPSQSVRPSTPSPRPIPGPSRSTTPGDKSSSTYRRKD